MFAVPLQPEPPQTIYVFEVVKQSNVLVTGPLTNHERKQLTIICSSRAWQYPKHSLQAEGFLIQVSISILVDAMIRFGRLRSKQT